MTPDQKKILIEDGRSFLEYQLDSDSLKMILLNGRTVIDSFKEWSDVELNKTQFEIRQGRNIDIVTGMYKNRVRIIGWSLNIQSSFGVSKEDIEYLASKVQSLFDFPSST